MYIRNDLSQLNLHISIFVFLMAIEKFSLIKSMKNIIVFCCCKILAGNWKNHWDHLQEILANVRKENKL